MQTVQQQLLSTSQKADEMMSKYDLRINNMAGDISLISEQLRQGFRLPDLKKDLKNEKSNPQKFVTKKPMTSSFQTSLTKTTK
jgi:hypothetical protein